MTTNSLTSSKSNKIIVAGIVAQLQDIATLRQEHFVCFSLDSNQQVIVQRTVFIGTLTGVLAHPREIFAGPITDRAFMVIVAHNHPSGDPEPSKADIKTTNQLVAAGQILGIPLYDHIIVAGGKHFSFQQNGLLFWEQLKNQSGKSTRICAHTN